MGSESESECVADSVSVSESEEASDNLERETVDLGETAQESLVNRICDLYAEENGEEATTNDLRDIFAEVKRMFAEEAEQEQYDETDEEQSEDDEQEEELTDESVNGEELTDEESVDALETFVVETSDNDMDETVRDTFESEMETALDTVRFVAKEHQADFIDTISELHGEQPSLQDLSDILEEIQAEFAEEAESEIFYSDEFAADFELALEHTREVAASHRESLVNSICDVFSEMNGKEATAEDLSGIFDRIKQTFAQEAEEQFLEI